MLELAKIRKENKEVGRELDIRKEAFGLILRSSQKHHNVKDSSEVIIDGVHCLHLRIEKGVAQQIYGTQNIPILSNKDPVTAKFTGSKGMSAGECTILPRAHSNVVREEAAVCWKGQQ